MTFTNEKYQLPKYLRVHKTQKEIPLVIGGQGVFVFESTSIDELNVFAIYNTEKTTGLSVLFKTDGICVHKLPNFENFVDSGNIAGLSKLEGAYYWFSLDTHNQRMTAGFGEARVENELYNYQFEKTEENKKFLESLRIISLPEEKSAIVPMRLLRDPITSRVPMLVKDKEHLTMRNIAKSHFLPKSFLSQASQKLYESISGKKFKLNDSDFPDFSKAIKYSIDTSGCWCNTTLKNKAGMFGGGDKETYLRITLGENNGESPGIPYVMEIWPAGNYSPIHNHGGANAVIRVLSGNIRANLYPFLSSQIKRCAYTDLKKNDITWISPTLNQVHKLENLGSKPCITIQSYIYDRSDTIHYDFFDYLDGEGMEKQFEPDSDMDFVTFKEIVRKEWTARPRWMSMFYLEQSA
jgi:hypothetical protein